MTEHDQKRIFDDWLEAHPNASNAARQDMKEMLGIPREGPGMVVGVGNPLRPGSLYERAIKNGATVVVITNPRPERVVFSEIDFASIEKSVAEKAGSYFHNGDDVPIEPVDFVDEGVGDDVQKQARNGDDPASVMQAFERLRAWLTQPATTRYVRHIACVDGVWLVEISAGGFVFRSETQTTLSGGVRSAIQAADTGLGG